MRDNTRLHATEELARAIKRQGRLQTWIAALIGRDKSYVTHVLKGRLTVSETDAKLISAALGHGDDIFFLFEFADAASNAAQEAVA